MAARAVRGEGNTPLPSRATPQTPVAVVVDDSDSEHSANADNDRAAPPRRRRRVETTAGGARGVRASPTPPPMAADAALLDIPAHVVIDAGLREALAQMSPATRRDVVADIVRGQAPQARAAATAANRRTGVPAPARPAPLPPIPVAAAAPAPVPAPLEPIPGLPPGIEIDAAFRAELAQMSPATRREVVNDIVRGQAARAAADAAARVGLDRGGGSGDGSGVVGDDDQHTTSGSSGDDQHVYQDLGDHDDDGVYHVFRGIDDPDDHHVDHDVDEHDDVEDYEEGSDSSDGGGLELHLDEEADNDRAAAGPRGPPGQPAAARGEPPRDLLALLQQAVAAARANAPADMAAAGAQPNAGGRNNRNRRNNDIDDNGDDGGHQGALHAMMALAQVFAGRAPRGLARRLDALHMMHAQAAVNGGEQPDVDNMSYEQLLALTERVGNVACGLSAVDLERASEIVRALPIDERCSICLCEYETGDVGRRLVACGHTFHADCVGTWFAERNTCPICKDCVADRAASPRRRGGRS